MKPLADLAEDRLAELEVRGWLRRLGDGLVMLGGPLLIALQRFDAVFRALALEHGAEERAVPALLPRAMVERIGYAERFAGTLLRSAAERDGTDPRSPVLLPAACFPLYLELEGARIDGRRRKVLTCAARVFRNEGRSHRLGRLTEFTVREILFFGTAGRVAELRRTLAAEATRVAAAAGLAYAVADAVDPFFFFLGDERARLKYDIPPATKQELTVRLPGAEPLALASFNLHGTFFTGHFDIAAEEGEVMHSGCCGFGLERWVLAYALTHGLDPELWPPIAAPAAAGTGAERGSAWSR